MTWHYTKTVQRLRKQACWRQRGLCYWCGGAMLTDVPSDHPQFLTADHLVPLHAGGETKHGNIVAACRKCNNERHPEYHMTKEELKKYVT